MLMTLWSLFIRRAPRRHFALLDSHGICLALRQSHESPVEPGWVETHSPSCSWLGQSLPRDALLTRQPLAKLELLGR